MNLIILNEFAFLPGENTSAMNIDVIFSDSCFSSHIQTNLNLKAKGLLI